MSQVWTELQTAVEMVKAIGGTREEALEIAAAIWDGDESQTLATLRRIRERRQQASLN